MKAVVGNIGVFGAALAQEVATQPAVLTAMDRGGIDLAILDGEAVPGGMGLCRQLKDEIFPCPPILVLTAQDAIDFKVQALRSGADDYVTKPFSFEELLARVEALGRRPKQMAPPTVRIDLDFDGTITTADVGMHLLERTAPHDEWWELHEQYERGEIGSRECIFDQWALVEGSEAELRRVAAEVEVDPGFVPAAPSWPSTARSSARWGRGTSSAAARPWRQPPSCGSGRTTSTRS